MEAQVCTECGRGEPDVAVIEVHGSTYCPECAPGDRADDAPKTVRCIECAHGSARWIAPRTYRCERSDCRTTFTFDTLADLAEYVRDTERDPAEPTTCPGCGEPYLYREKLDDQAGFFYVHAVDWSGGNVSPKARMSYDEGCRVPESKFPP